MSEDMVLKAIRKSIDHWIDNARKAWSGSLNKDDISSKKCALCDLFYDEDYVGDPEWLCDGCPLKSSGDRCIDDGSSWMAVQKAIEDDDMETAYCASLAMLCKLRWLDVGRESKKKCLHTETRHSVT